MLTSAGGLSEQSMHNLFSYALATALAEQLVLDPGQLIQQFINMLAIGHDWRNLSDEDIVQEARLDRLARHREKKDEVV